MAKLDVKCSSCLLVAILALGGCSFFFDFGDRALESELGEFDCSLPRGDLIEEFGGMPDWYEKWSFSLDESCLSELKNRAASRGYTETACSELGGNRERGSHSALCWSDPDATHYYSNFSFVGEREVIWERYTT